METELRKLAPAVLKKMVRSAGLAPASPDWHSGILLLNDERERAARTATNAPAPLTTKRTNTAANSELEFAPAGDFTAVLSVFQAHLPVALTNMVSQAVRPLDWKARGKGIRQYRSVS